MLRGWSGLALEVAGAETLAVFVQAYEHVARGPFSAAAQDSPSTNPSACASDQPRTSASTLNFSLDRTFIAAPCSWYGSRKKQLTGQELAGKSHGRPSHGNTLSRKSHGLRRGDLLPFATSAVSDQIGTTTIELFASRYGLSKGFFTLGDMRTGHPDQDRRN